MPSTRKIDGVKFYVWPNDHDPRHVHGEYGGLMVIVDLKLDGLWPYPTDPEKSAGREIWQMLDMSSIAPVNGLKN
jgi:hypothetical protein